MNILESKKKKKFLLEIMMSFLIKKLYDNVTFKYGEKIILNKINFIIHKNKLNVISSTSGTGNRFVDTPSYPIL